MSVQRQHANTSFAPIENTLVSCTNSSENAERSAALAVAGTPTRCVKSFETLLKAFRCMQYSAVVKCAMANHVGTVL